MTREVHAELNLEAVLFDSFGFDEFQPGQRPVIEDVVGGCPTVAVMPTGAGKSLCYQLPALVFEGITLVVSPLISLMKDQVDSLNARGIPAAFLNSTLGYEQQEAVLEAVKEGAYKLLYVAPERFRSHRFLRAVERLDVELLAIDEAHCISRWGHDFRPDYGRLGAVVDQLKPSRILACTATATPNVRSDIAQTLGLDEPSVHVAGFLRTNLHLSCQLCRGEKDREARLLRLLDEFGDEDGGLILYASTRRRVERFAELCQTVVGDDVVVYHGGLGDEERHEAQDRFMNGEARIAVATNAFGMGIDRSDIRGVIHLDLPRTIEAYYQEVGRAGRDGKPSRCTLLFNPIDRRTHEFLIDLSHPQYEWISAVWNIIIRQGRRVWSISDIRNSLDVRLANQQIESALKQLVKIGAVWDDGVDAWVFNDDAPHELEQLGIDFNSLEMRRRSELSKLDHLCEFVYDSECRHSAILGYFGESFEETECPGCDNCDDLARLDGDASPHELTEAESLIIRQALAGVARSDGRFGLKRVAGMLAGSKAKNIAGSALAELTTYGLLKAHGTDACVDLLHAFVDCGLCALSGGRYPMIRISRLGWEVMQERRKPRVSMPSGFSRAKVKRDETTPPSVTHSPVAESLRGFRRREAERRKVPPYVIFTDRTLSELAEHPPSSREEFLSIHGLGEGRWAQYGQRLIEEIEIL